MGILSTNSIRSPKRHALQASQNNSRNSIFNNSQQLSTWVLALVPAPAPATVAPAANAPLAGIKSMTARMIPTRREFICHDHSAVCLWERDGKLLVGKKMEEVERESGRRTTSSSSCPRKLTGCRFVFLPLD